MKTKWPEHQRSTFSFLGVISSNRGVALRLLISLCLALIPVLPLKGKTINDEDLRKKKNGWYMTGLPLVNYTTDDGIGYGARAFLYYNGKQGDSYFDTAPYFMQLYAQYFATTKGIQYHELNLDMPYLAGSRFRLKSSFVYDRDLNANYFPLGSDSTRSRLTDINGRSYTRYSNYESDFLKNGDHENYKFNKYTRTIPRYFLDIYRDLWKDIKIMGGLQISRAEIESWQDRSFKTGGTRYTASQPTLLDLTHPRGSEGGWTNYGKLGLVWDRRDYEPDPKNGTYADYALEGSSRGFGSDYTYIRHTLCGHFYHQIFRPLVVALRAAYTDASGDIPFYELNQFSFAEIRQNGLGGNRTLRGFQKDRFVGNTMTLGNAELRWQFWETTPFGERFAFKLVGFVDTGNVYDNAADPFTSPAWGYYRNSFGGGLVIAWNLATIVHAYVGFSREDRSIFVNFNHNY